MYDYRENISKSITKASVRRTNKWRRRRQSQCQMKNQVTKHEFLFSCSDLDAKGKCCHNFARNVDITLPEKFNVRGKPRQKSHHVFTPSCTLSTLTTGNTPLTHTNSFPYMYSNLLYCFSLLFHSIGSLYLPNVFPISNILLSLCFLLTFFSHDHDIFTDFSLLLHSFF